MENSSVMDGLSVAWRIVLWPAVACGCRCDLVLFVGACSSN